MYPLPANQVKVAVLMGGTSREREISLQSGKCVTNALKKIGVKVASYDIKPDCLDILDDKTIDVFFIALHGDFGEDGQLQENLESKGLVYTGSPSKASKLAFDKWASKDFFSSAGILTPEAVLFEPKLADGEIENQIGKLGTKIVVKPLRQGSTLGISIAETPEAAVEAGRKCEAEFGDCMFEKFIPGRELSVSIIGNLALPIIEIRPNAGFYDYHAKYIDDKTQYLFDTVTQPGTVNKVHEYAVDSFNVIGCRGAARVDFILSEDNKPYVLEINTIPGMTTHSLLPKAAEKVGIPLEQLCLMMIEMAQADASEKHAVRQSSPGPARR